MDHSVLSCVVKFFARVKRKGYNFAKMAATVTKLTVLFVFGCTNWQPKVHFLGPKQENGSTKYKIRNRMHFTNMVTLDVYESMFIVRIMLHVNANLAYSAISVLHVWK